MRSILDPLGAYLEVFEEYGERMTAPLSDAQRARAEEIDAKEERGEATPEESKEAFSLVWPSYFADPATAPPCPDLALDAATLAGTFASVREHEQAGTLTRRLPDVPSSIPVLFVHGAKSPMPVRTTTMTAELIPHARVEILPDAGHFLWHQGPSGNARRDRAVRPERARLAIRSASLPAERLDSPPVLLGRSRPTGNGSRRARQPPFFGAPLSLGHRLGGLLEQRCGDTGRTALLGNLENRDRPVRLSDLDLDDVIRAYVFGGLHALAVQSHPAAEHGLGRCGAGLEEPRGPEPPVNADTRRHRSHALTTFLAERWISAPARISVVESSPTTGDAKWERS